MQIFKNRYLIIATCLFYPFIAFLNIQSPNLNCYRRAHAVLNISNRVLALYRSSGEYTRMLQKECASYWQGHLDNSRSMIIAGAERAKNCKVTIFGGGNCFDIPIEHLAENFKEVLLMDLDTQSPVGAIGVLPENLQSKVLIRQQDITSISARFIAAAEEIIARSDTAEVAIEAIISLMDGINMPVWNISEEEKSDYIICSLITSAVMFLEFKYVEKMLEDKFDELEVISYRATHDNKIWENAKQNMRMRVIDSIFDRLQQSLNPGGVIYFADTVLKNLITDDGGIESVSRTIPQIEGVNELSELFKNRFIIKQQNSWFWEVKPLQYGEDGVTQKIEAYILTLP